MTITSSSSDLGGAIFNGGDMTLTGSTLSGNSASNRGGAIYTFAGFDLLFIANTTIAGNIASGVSGGGGIYFGGGAMTLVNSTLSDNEASTGPGGGFLRYTNTQGNADASLTIRDDPDLLPVAGNWGEVSSGLQRFRLSTTVSLYVNMRPTQRGKGKE